MSDQGSGNGTSKTKKSARPKRSRLGRGLSALVDLPSVDPVVLDHSSSSDAKSDNSAGGERGASEGSQEEGVGVNKGAGVGAGDSVGGEDVERGATGGTETGEEGSTELGERFGSGGADSERVVKLSVGAIQENRDQPRRVFDEDRLNDLAGSIAVHGVMQPIVVRAIGGGGASGEGSGYELIAGERRWRASRIAGLETIPAIVREVDDETSAQLALIENVQREDLNVIELAEGYRVLSDRYGMTQEQISGTVGVSRSLVANTVRLLDLPDEVRSLIVEGKLSSGHGKVLLSLGVPEKQRKFASRCIKEGWNIRLLQKAVDDDSDGVASQDDSAGGAGGSGSSGGVDSEADRALSVLRDLERQVGDELGTRVKIRTDKSRTRGRVVIEFYDLDQFDGLLGRLGVTTRE